MASSHGTAPALAWLVLLVIGAAGQIPNQDVRRLPVPGRAWAVEITLPNFIIRQDALNADGRGRRLRAEIEAEGCVLTLNLVPASTPKVSSKDLRDLAAERVRAELTVKRDDFKISQYRQTPTIEYLVRDFKGQPLNQKHLHAYLSRDDVWIDIHLSKTNFREGDEKLFHTILDSLRLTDSAGRSLDQPR